MAREAGGWFPTTHHSLLAAVRGGAEECRDLALGALMEAYWKPVYKYLRVRWNCGVEDAEDTTQAFFARVLEKDIFGAYDPSRGTFRTFLRVCLDRLVLNQRKAAGRQKRGGPEAGRSFDFDSAESEIAVRSPTLLSPENLFYQEWVRSLFDRAVQALRSELAGRGRESTFLVFERYDLDNEDGSLSYDDLAREFGIPVTQVTNFLAAARRGFRRIVLAELRSLTATDREYRREAQRLFGVQKP